MAYLPFFCSKTASLGKGFTLLELLVAIAIFAVLASLAYSGLLTVMEVQHRTEETLQQFTRLQLAISWMQRDAEQYISRPIRNEFGDTQPVLQLRNTTPIRLEFTQLGWRNPAQQPRSQLQRVAYVFEQETLWRYSWRVLDRAQDSQPEKVALLTDVKSVEWRVLDENLQWLSEYPNSVVNNTSQNILPAAKRPVALPQFRALEMSITSKKWGKITRLFSVAGT